MPAPPSKRSQLQFKIMTLIQLGGVLALMPFVGPFLIFVWVSAISALTCGMWIAIVDPGNNPWQKASDEAKKIYWMGAILGTMGAVLFLGSAAVILLGIVNVWIAIMGMHLWVFWTFDLWAGVGRFKKYQEDKQKLDQVMQPFVGKVAPTWMNQIADRGWNGYSQTQDGKLSKSNSGGGAKRVLEGLSEKVENLGA